MVPKVFIRVSKDESFNRDSRESNESFFKRTSRDFHKKVSFEGASRELQVSFKRASSELLGSLKTILDQKRQTFHKLCMTTFLQVCCIIHYL